MPTLPAASTAEPDFAITLASTSRLIPAMPIAETIPAVVAGMSATRSAVRKAVKAGAAVGVGKG